VLGTAATEIGDSDEAVVEVSKENVATADGLTVVASATCVEPVVSPVAVLVSLTATASSGFPEAADVGEASHGLDRELAGCHSGVYKFLHFSFAFSAVLAKLSRCL
jgi:hypothetical protein